MSVDNGRVREEQPLGPLMVGLQGQRLSAGERTLLQHPLIGGVILFARNVGSPTQLRALTDEIHRLRSPALLVAVDQEGGRVQRCVDGFTRLPAARSYGDAFDVSREVGLARARAGGLVMASELRRVGIDLSFAPVLDLDLGLSGVIGDRAFHDDPISVSELARAWIDGMRAAGMPCTGKHFPGHGGVIPDSHLDLPVDQRGLAELEQADITPYTRLVESGHLDAVMTAHIVYPAVDRHPASFSSRWVMDILRRQLGFDGVVFADDLGMQGAAVMGSIPERASRALQAGADMVMVCNDLDVLPDLLAELGPEPHEGAARRRRRLSAAVGGPPPADAEALARSLLRE